MIKKKVKWFLRKAKAERNFDVDVETPIEESLVRLNLIKDKKLTNAAILLFGKNPQKFFLQSKIRCARFKGIKPLDFIDMKVLDGTILELREKAIKFVMRNIKHAVYFDADRRYDKWEYPLRAVEEAITNSLAHRDYYSAAEIQLSIFDDRIEMWNPGELPKPLTVKDLKKAHQSIPRNKLIADLLFMVKYIEKWGTGTNRIMEEMLKNKLPEPNFLLKSGSFVIELIGPGNKLDDGMELEKINILEFNKRQKKAIKYLKQNKRITKEIYLSLNNISSATAKRDIKDLINKKMLRQIGKGPRVYYVLKL